MQYKILVMVMVSLGLQEVIAAPSVDLPEEIFTSYYSEYNFNDTDYRLPTSIIPKEYAIKISPNMDLFTFNGEVKIVFTVATPTNELTLHLKQLIIRGIRFEPFLSISNIEIEPELDFLTIRLGSNLPNNTQEYALYINYTGTIQDDNTGFYRSWYQENNQTKWLAATQLQAIHARKVFPCFDEPSFKAVFKIAIDCPERYNCISNMHELNRTANLIHFHPTPRMSTYLVAFMVSEFVTGLQTTNSSFRVISRPDGRSMTQYAFTLGQSILEETELYFRLGYYDMHDNLKMDQVAIPDFGAGAMENWGLLKYRESVLLYSFLESSTRHRQNIARLLTHEIVHMWFGNYITCHWWSDIWLNEGFATLFQHYITERVENFGMDDQFVISQLQTALIADTPLNAPPMSNPNVNTPDQISAQFGLISYNKAGSILRMIEHLVTPVNFQEALANLLTNNTFGIIRPDDLYEKLQASSGDRLNMTIKTIMETWVDRSGYPVVDVTVVPNSITLTQRRFVPRNTTAQQQLYNIPIAFYSSTSINNSINTTPTQMLSTQTLTINIATPTGGWHIFNTQQSGYYRVNYDNTTWNNIITALNSSARTNIHRLNRAQIVDDAFNFARENQMTYSRMFSIIQFLEHETDYAPWAAAQAGFNYMRIHFGKLPNVTRILDDHISTLLNSTLEDLGFNANNSDPNLRKLFRSNSLNLACAVGHQRCVRSARDLFKSLRDNNIFWVNPDIREYVYCNGIRHGDDAEYNFLWQRFRNINIASEESVILGALGCTNRQNKVLELLRRIIEPNSLIRDHDKLFVFNSALSGNPENAETCLNFLMSNITTIKQVYGSQRLQAMMTSLTQRLTRSQLGVFISFVNASPHLSQEEKQSGVAAQNRALADLDWALSHEADVRTWITAKYSSAAAMSSSLVLLFAVLTTFFFDNLTRTL